MTSDLEMLVRAEDISLAFRPPRWRAFSYRYWLRHQQPSDVLRAMAAAARGEYEPARRFGLELT